MDADHHRSVNPRSPLDVDRQAEMLANRVRKRLRHLAPRFARRRIEVFRLYDWDIPEIRAVVDWYAGHLVVGEYMRRQSATEWLPAMGRAVARALEVPEDRLHLKARYAGKRDGVRYERVAHTERKITVAERDFRFRVNPWDFVDTGLFADHRDTRQMVREMAAGKDLLNLYAYTATFACYAARGGARGTVSVDRSESVVQWARENFALNGLDPQANVLIHADAFDFLRRARRQDRRFDLAVVDPPSYSTTRGRNLSFDILADHPRLLAAVIALMRPGGTILFSTNHQGFEARFEGLAVASIEEITDATIPEDYVRNRSPIHRCWRMALAADERGQAQTQ
jgi:23S rRNA (cytosine1962-C5)-methyltransferase